MAFDSVRKLYSPIACFPWEEIVRSVFLESLCKEGKCCVHGFTSKEVGDTVTFQRGLYEKHSSMAVTKDPNCLIYSGSEGLHP